MAGRWWVVSVPHTQDPELDTAGDMACLCYCTAKPQPQFSLFIGLPVVAAALYWCAERSGDDTRPPKNEIGKSLLAPEGVCCCGGAAVVRTGGCGQHFKLTKVAAMDSEPSDGFQDCLSFSRGGSVLCTHASCLGQSHGLSNRS